MDRINPFEFFEIGKGLRAALSLEDDALASEAVWPLLECRTAVTKILDPTFFPLVFSRPEAESISRTLDGIFSRHLEKIDESGNPQLKWPFPIDAKIPDWELGLLRTKIKAFEQVYGAELRGAATYVVPQRGIFSTPALVDKTDESFPQELLSFISKKTCSEWKQAGRCLAFGLYSASGFHVARGVEAMMEVYHQNICPAGKNGQKLWKDYIEDFRSCLAGQVQGIPSSRVIVYIEQMKDDFRNPLMHPRVVLSESDARMLLSSGESLVILMAQELRTAFQTGAVQAG